MFITGVRVVPPLGIPKTITVSLFTNDQQNAKLSFPANYQTKEDMKKAILDSIKLSNGFDTIWTNITYHSISSYISNVIYPRYR